MLRLLLIYLVFFSTVSKGQQVTTLAGTAGLAGTTNGSAFSARFNSPGAVVSDALGNIYVADRLNNTIRKITINGQVSIWAGTGLAGSTDGPGVSATFYEPSGLAIDTAGNLYVADTRNYKIRKIDVTGNVTTLAGTGIFGTTNGPALSSQFGLPVSIACNADGTILYVSDYSTHVIRRIQAGTVTSFAGSAYLSGSTDGTGSAARFDHPNGLFLEANGNLLVADEWNHKIRQITPLGLVTTVAGNGLPAVADGAFGAASFHFPSGLVKAPSGDLFVSDGSGHTIRRLQGGLVSTWCGSPGVSGSANGTGTTARFNQPLGLAWSPMHASVIIADEQNHLIRKANLVSTASISLSPALNDTLCSADSIDLIITPAGWSSYTIYEGSQIRGFSLSSNTIRIAPLSPGPHALYATAVDASGGTATSPFLALILLNSSPVTINSSAGASICTGASTVLSTQSGSAYLWSTGASTSALTVNSPGTYTVTVTLPSGCQSQSAPFTLSQLPLPSTAISPSAPLSLCQGDSVLISGPPSTSWIWSTGATTQSIYAQIGSYTLTVTNAAGCSATSSPFVINQLAGSVLTVNPAGPLTLFQGDSVQLTAASGFSNYQWSTGAGTQSIWVSQAGSYTVSALSSVGCNSTSVPVQVFIISPASMITVSGPTQFCEGDSTVLICNLPFPVQWYLNGSAISGATSAQYIVKQTGYFSVSVLSGSNTYFSDSVYIDVLPSPLAPYLPDTLVCRGDVVLLNVPQQSGANLNWFSQPNGGIAFYTGWQYLTPPLNNNQTYYLQATGLNGCSSIRNPFEIQVQAVPQASFDYTSIFQSGVYTTTFQNTSLLATNYLWIFGDTLIAGNVSTDTDPIYTYPSAGVYSVVLVAQNTNGCADTLIKDILVSGNNPHYLPNTFTPNGDGKNDVFRLRGDRIALEEMIIYDQWGGLVWRGDQSSVGWDGKRDGEPAPNASYAYRVRFIDRDAQSKVLSGIITLIR